jgi:negative regulator of flagellin synthesis FlgM
MKIDTNLPTATASSANQQHVRTPLQRMGPADSANPGQIQQGGATAHVSATVAVPRTAQPPDTAEISGVVPSISDLATAANSAPDVRHPKVQALRNAVEQGTYQVSPERIAESMLAQATSKLR